MTKNTKQENSENFKYDLMISFQFSGIPAEIRIINIKKVEAMFGGQKVFCSENAESFFKENKMSDTEIYDFCLEEQKKTREIVFFIGYVRPSPGMKLELDLAKELGQKGKLIIQRGLNNLPWVQEYIEYCGVDNVRVIDFT
jgi:hypothetical protein